MGMYGAKNGLQAKIDGHTLAAFMRIRDKSGTRWENLTKPKFQNYKSDAKNMASSIGIAVNTAFCKTKKRCQGDATNQTRDSKVIARRKPKKDQSAASSCN